MIPFFKKFQAAQRPRCAALVAAAGSSTRMGGINKLLQPLDGIPVLVRTLTALERAQRVDSIVIATREEDLITVSQLCKTYGITKCKKVIRGGESRVHSVLLAALEAAPEAELLAVQDGARPLVTPELIDQVISAAARCGAAAPAVVRSAPDPMSETERRVLACIGPKAKGVEELGAASGLPTGLLLGTLMKLELAGRVTCLPGKRYILR